MKKMMAKRNMVVLFLSLFLIANESFAQVTEKTFEKFRVEQSAIGKVFFESGSLQKRKDILASPGPDDNSKDKDAQDALREQYKVALSGINRIDELKNQVIIPTTNNLNSCFNLVNVQRIISPTNEYLGKSFASVINENIDILANAIPKERRGWFKNVVTLVLNNPIVSAFTRSNPITSVVHDVVTHALAASEDGNLQQKTLSDFSLVIAPYLIFYSTIDEKTDRFYDRSMQLETSLRISQNRLDKINSQITKLLEKKGGNTTEEKLKTLFDLANADNLTTAQVLRQLNSADVSLLKRYIEAVVVVEEDLIDINQSIKTTYNSYISDLRTILETAKNNTNLKFKPDAIQTAKDSFRDMI